MRERIVLLLMLGMLTAAVPVEAVRPLDERAIAALDALAGAEGASAFALVEKATRAQAAMAGLAVGELSAPTADAPSTLALALLAQRGVAPSPAQLAAIGGLDAAAPEVRAATANVLASFHAFDAAARTGDLSLVVTTRLALVAAVLDLQGALERAAPHGVPADVVAPPALVLRFSVSDDLYAEDVALVVDSGGDDVHANNAGGSGLLRDFETCFATGEGAAALADLGGNDRYGSLTRGCGVVGGGNGGAGFLYDAAGSDVYMAANDATIGAGEAGAGFLYDVGGNDRYLAGGWGTNGGAYPGGLGLLLDDGGDDEYVATFDGVNGGAVGGHGMLYDTGGNDVYRSDGSGANGGATLGSGLLYDAAGDDRYVSGWGSVNGGALGGVGVLYDAAGLDWYDDREGGTGFDVTLVPKETNGAQLDR